MIDTEAFSDGFCSDCASYEFVCDEIVSSVDTTMTVNAGSCIGFLNLVADCPDYRSVDAVRIVFSSPAKQLCKSIDLSFDCV